MTALSPKPFPLSLTHPEIRGLGGRGGVPQRGFLFAFPLPAVDTQVVMMEKWVRELRVAAQVHREPLCRTPFFL